MKAIDLFSGCGGFSAGARIAGIEVIWAANHWPVAVEWYARNHPNATTLCQDLQQADWQQVPQHDILLAAPCCQGHSKARGKSANNPQHDASRSTAWAVVSALEFHQPAVSVVENVPEFIEWSLYPAWAMAVQALGYQIAPHVIDAADYGAPQNRVRLFLVLTKSRAPLFLNLRRERDIPASSFLDLEGGNWQPINKPGRAKATLERVENGRRQYGDVFLMPYYGNGSGKTGRSIHRPIGTITTRDRWAIVRGNEMRMINRFECRAGMSYTESFLIPENHKLAVHMLGNSICPVPVSRVLEEIKVAA